MIRFGGPVIRENEKDVRAGKNSNRAFDDPMEIVKYCKEKGYTATIAPKVSLDDTKGINRIRQIFKENNIMIAEVGYWDNLVDTDKDTRAYHRQKIVESLALADELGARCAVDIFGSYCHGNGNTKHTAENFSDKAFEEAVEMARYFIDMVKPITTYFTYEIFPFNVVDSPEMIYKLIKAVDRKMFGVHLDLVNLINSPRAYFSSGDIMRECIKLFGDKIVAAHAKDVKMKEPAISVILEEVVAGTGALDIASFVRELHKLPHEVPLILEHLVTEQEYDTAAAHYRHAALQEGIKI